MGFSKGWRKARQPVRAGGKDFAREAMETAKSGTANYGASEREKQLWRFGVEKRRWPGTEVAA